MKRRLAATLGVCGLLSTGAALHAEAGGATMELQTENLAREFGHVLHSSATVELLQPLLEPLGLLGQTLAAALIVGSLMLRMRKDAVQMETLASMLLKVGIIATIPLWKGWTLESGTALSRLLGEPAVAGASLVLEEAPDRGAVSPLLGRLWTLGEQWRLEGSPMHDAMAGDWKEGSGKDEQRVAEGWNWAKPPVTRERSPAEIAWAAETNARRAEWVHSLVMGSAGVVQFTYALHYLFETLRLLLFHAGFALAPLCVAGLGTQVLGGQSARALLGLLCIAAWPLGWGVANVASSVMLDGALQVAHWTSSSAMFPKLEDDTQRTLAMAAPYLSWWALGLMAVLTLVICLWMAAALMLGPWALHRMISKGARWAEATLVRDA